MNSVKSAIDWRLAREIIWRASIFIVAVGILVVVVTRWNHWQGDAEWQTTDDAYLQSDITPIATKVAGYIRDLPMQDYEHVRAGQLLAEIVDDDYRAVVAQADANIAAAVAQSEALQAQRDLQAANVRAAKAVVNATAAALDQNSRDLARQRRLLQTGSSSTEAAEKLDTTHSQLTAQLAQNHAQADAATKQLGVLAAQQAQIDAAIGSQRAALKVASLNLTYTRIVATQDGVIGQRQVKPGQYVGIGAQITTLTPLPHVWVIANYKETQLTHMAAGQKAEVAVDTFPGHTLRGHLLAFAPASGSQFALLPPDNATGNFTKVVQRVAVKIAIDDTDGIGDRLLPGMSVVSKIDTRSGRQR
ncbi:MAG TPA: HlyD family secretion protein [Acetobacteraceae bacterium]|nr:HlyD family secretion protein [Acetobacteraceae bacterium]